MSNRLDQERESRLQPERMEYAVKQIKALGYTISHRSGTKVVFTHNSHPVTLFPYSGWHTGKSITDGRGIENLLKQLNQKP